ncbi:MAG: methyltransferase [Rhodobacterales bacterium]|nr:methyltransferase [Rhodobacterales bacterium]
MISLDRPAPGLVVAQPKRGFRYGAEAFWLVGFALAHATPSTALDLGTGSGVLAFLLAGQGIATTGVDIRPEWQPLWAQSLALSKTAAPVDLRLQDALVDVDGDWPLVISNPPFFPVGAGPTSPDPWKAAARTEGNGTLADFVRAGLKQTALEGQFCLVFPVERFPEVVRATETCEGHVAAAVQVGTRRVLVRLQHGKKAPCRLIRVEDDGEEARRWYALAGAAIAGATHPG